jgi:hypothetical protein
MGGHANPPEDLAIQEDPKSAEWRKMREAQRDRVQLPLPMKIPPIKRVVAKPDAMETKRKLLMPTINAKHCKTTYRLKPHAAPCTNDEHCECICKSCSDMRGEKPWDPTKSSWNPSF